MIVRSIGCINSESVKLSVDHLPYLFFSFTGDEIIYKRLASLLATKKSTLRCSDFFNALPIVFFIIMVCNYVSKGESFHSWPSAVGD